MPKITPRFAFIADSLMEEGKTFTALEYCKRGTADYPDYPTGFILLGRVYLTLNDVVAAKNVLQQALTRFPEDSAIADLLFQAESLAGIESPTDGINDIVDGVDSTFNEQTLDETLLDTFVPPSADSLPLNSDPFENSTVVLHNADNLLFEDIPEIDSIFLPDGSDVQDVIAPEKDFSVDDDFVSNHDFDTNIEDIFVTDVASNGEMSVSEILNDEPELEPNWQIIKDEIGSAISDMIHQNSELSQDSSAVDMAELPSNPTIDEPEEHFLPNITEASSQHQTVTEEPTIAEDFISEEYIELDSNLLIAFQDEYTAIGEQTLHDDELSDYLGGTELMNNGETTPVNEVFNVLEDYSSEIDEFSSDSDNNLLTVLSDEYTATGEDFESFDVAEEKVVSLHQPEDIELVPEDVSIVEEYIDMDNDLLTALSDEYTATGEEFESFDVAEEEVVSLHQPEDIELAPEDVSIVEEYIDMDNDLLTALSDEYTATGEDFESFDVAEEVLSLNKSEKEDIELTPEDVSIVEEYINMDNDLLTALSDEYTATGEDFESFDVAEEKVVSLHQPEDIELAPEDVSIVEEYINMDNDLLTALSDEYTATGDDSIFPPAELEVEILGHLPKEQEPHVKKEKVFSEVQLHNTSMEKLAEKVNTFYTEDDKQEVLISFLPADEDETENSPMVLSSDVSTVPEHAPEMSVVELLPEMIEHNKQKLESDSNKFGMSLLEEEAIAEEGSDEVLTIIGNLYAESTMESDVREFSPQGEFPTIVPDDDSTDEDSDEEIIMSGQPVIVPKRTPLEIIPGQKNRQAAFVSTDVHLIPGLLGLANQIHVPTADIASEFMLPQWAELPEFEGWVSPIKEGVFVMPSSSTQVQSPNDSALNSMIRAIEEATEHRPAPIRTPEHPAYDYADMLESDDSIPQLSSPTLAAIYAKQRAYMQAARMYDLLAQQYPEREAEYRALAQEMRELERQQA